MATTARRELQQAEGGALTLPRGGWTALLIGLFGLYYIAPGLPLSLVLLALCAVVCLRQLPLAISLVPLAMPFWMLPKHLGHPKPEFALGETAIALCAAAFALLQGRALLTSGGVRRRVWRRLTHPTGLDLAVALFFVAATAATFAARGGELRHLAESKYRIAILEPLIYYALAASTLRDARSMLRALWALVGAGLVVALLGLGQYIFRPNTLQGTIWVGTVPHPARFVNAVYGSPDNVGLLLDRAIPVAVVLGLLALALYRVRGAAPPAHGRSHAIYVGSAGAAPARLPEAAAPRNPFAVVLPWLALAPLVATLLLSNSRGGYVVAAAAAILGLLLWRMRATGWDARARRFTLAGTGGVVIVAALVLWKLRHGLSTSERLMVWKSALAMIRDHPIFGVGPDNFLYYYFNKSIAARAGINCLPDKGVALPAKSYMDPNAWREPCLSHPHNIVLDVWLSTGILGLTAVAIILVIAARYAWRTLRLLRSEDTHVVSQGIGGAASLASLQAIQIGCIVVVAATLAHGLVDNALFLPDLAVFFWLALALTANLRALLLR